MKGRVFDLHGLNKAEIFNWAIKEIIKYLDWENDTLAGKALHYIKVPIIIKPNNLDLDQGESTMDNADKAIFQEEIK